MAILKDIIRYGKVRNYGDTELWVISELCKLACLDLQSVSTDGLELSAAKTSADTMLPYMYVYGNDTWIVISEENPAKYEISSVYEYVWYGLIQLIAWNIMFLSCGKDYKTSVRLGVHACVSAFCQTRC